MSKFSLILEALQTVPPRPPVPPCSTELSIGHGTLCFHGGTKGVDTAYRSPKVPTPMNSPDTSAANDKLHAEVERMQASQKALREKMPLGVVTPQQMPEILCRGIHQFRTSYGALPNVPNLPCGECHMSGGVVG